MISYCITCKDRLHHLKATLRKTLLCLDGDDDIVLLDYNSTDGLSSWIKCLNSPKIKFIQLDEGNVPFHTARAKNIAHLHAQNKIVCNLDADNWITPQFVSYIKSNIDPQHILHASPITFGGGAGRMVLYKDVFIKICGYNEAFLTWGYDVTEFLYRARGLKYTLKKIPQDLLTFIEHGDDERHLAGCKNIRISVNQNKQIFKAGIRPIIWGTAKIR